MRTSIDDAVLAELLELCETDLKTVDISRQLGISWDTVNRYRRSLMNDRSEKAEDIYQYSGHRTPLSYARQLAKLRRSEAATEMHMLPDRLGRLERGEQDARYEDLREMVRCYRTRLPGLSGDHLLGFEDLRVFSPTHRAVSVF